MTTKTIKVLLQAKSATANPLNLEIKMDGVTVFNNTVTDTSVLTPGVTNPNTSFTFDVDVGDLIPNSGVPTVTKTFTVTPTGGDIKIEQFTSNYTLWFENTGTPENPQMTTIYGNATDFWTMNITAQPTWDGQALTQRYNFVANTNTGPGELVINNGEACEVVVAVPLYNTAPPAP